MPKLQPVSLAGRQHAHRVGVPPSEIRAWEEIGVTHSDYATEILRAENRRTSVPLADGTTVDLTDSELKRFRGLDYARRIVLEDCRIVYALTECCHASAKGGETGIICRACYYPCDEELGGTADVVTGVLPDVVRLLSRYQALAGD